jgi:hypothetical protein
MEIASEASLHIGFAVPIINKKATKHSEISVFRMSHWQLKAIYWR